jgi:hypothetical protein
MPTLASHLAIEMAVGAPTVVGSLAVFPLIADREPSVRYISFAGAVQQGATVKELSAMASVNDLIVHNPLDAQRRRRSGSAARRAPPRPRRAVAARSALPVPVSCVEAGRWDGARHDEAFVPAPQTANPRLRQMKNTQARASLAPPACRRVPSRARSGGGRRHRRTPRRQLPHGRCTARSFRATRSTRSRRSSRCRRRSRRSRADRAAARSPMHAGARGRARGGAAVRVRRARRDRTDLRARACRAHGVCR